GSRLGAAMTPSLVVLLIASHGWRAAFVTFGVLGLFWSGIWYWYYRDTPAEHPSVNEAERELLARSLGGTRRTAQSLPWKRILASPTVWLLCLMYFCYSYCLAVYLDWFPKYLNAHRGFDLLKMGFYSSLPLLAGTGGDLLGGWVSDIWAERTGNLRLAR